MLTAVRLGGYAGVLGLVFGAAWAAGSAFGPAPVVTPPAAVSPQMGGAPMADMPEAPHATGTTRPAADGLASFAGGYGLRPVTTAFTAGSSARLDLTIDGPDGRPLTSFAARPDSTPLRLLVVRRDGAGLQVLSPTMAPDGTWSTPLRLPTAGAWRVLADFTPVGGAAMVLGTDVFVPGPFGPLEFPPARAAQVDGYQVRIDGDLTAGTPSALFATVSRDGRAVTDLEPEQGTFGRLVALRVGDLAYTPVTALTRAVSSADRSGPAIAFTAEVPTDGSYRLFLLFRHDGEIHTVDFTVPTAPAR